MKKFKERWEIQHNWQLIFPLLGVVGLIYSAYKLSLVIVKEPHFYVSILVTLVLTFIILKFTLFIFKKLEKKWVLTYKWEMIRVFLVFAITGSSSLYIGGPIIKLLGITKDNLAPILYWVLFIFIGLMFYQILLVLFGWLFGQFTFFWEMEKKILRKLGLGLFLKEK
ncbi:MAG: hypothetical protein IIB06_09390 [Bacteroidetes bacterium]|nr:hypothetical protein [Bacteroidota bacterium]